LLELGATPVACVLATQITKDVQLQNIPDLPELFQARKTQKMPSLTLKKYKKNSITMSSKKTIDNKLYKRAISVAMPLVGPFISSDQQSEMQAETIKIAIIYIVREHLSLSSIMLWKIIFSWDTNS
jgi:hypothetical protein